MNIYFSHGKLGTPDGAKIQRLAAVAEAQEHSTQSIGYTKTLNPDLRVARLKGILEKDPAEKILVGSSMGGYASLVAAMQVPVKGIFLLAPALYLAGYHTQNFSPEAKQITIVHGWDDETVPVEHSIRFARKHRTTLHILNSDHGLYSALDEITQLFAQFLEIQGEV